jgi:PKHD-type hydroxylase
MLLCIPDILTAEELGRLRALAAQAPWASGESAGPQARLAKHNLQVPQDAEELREMRGTVMRALNRNPLLLSAALPLKVLPPNFNRYTPEHSHYGWHTDSTLRWLPDGSCLRTDLSATLFLSTPGDYDGGELQVEDTYGTQQVRLEAGSVVLYPSGSIHEVRPVTRGERLACYLFIQSMVKDPGCRRHLYEMDLALRALRGKCGEDDPDVIRLTGSYNNLLRRWSEC